jgi:hypothetical protein
MIAFKNIAFNIYTYININLSHLKHLILEIKILFAIFISIIHIINMRVFKSIFSFSTRKLFVGGNWKSNNTLEQTKDLVNNVINKMEYDPKIVGSFSLI